MANEFIIKKGLISKANSVVSGSLIVTDGISGSFSGSFEGDGSGLTNIPAVSPFPFVGDAQITGSLIVSGSSTGIQLESPASSPGDNSIVRLGSKGTTTSNGLEIRTNSGYLQIGPQNSSYSHFYTDRGRFYFNKSAYFAGNLYSVGQDFVIGRNNGTSDTIRLGDNSIEFDLNSTNMLFISSSHLISGSAISTASFGTYLGDGSQLTGISAGSTFPFTGDASITGSLIISGSFIPTGNTPLNLYNVIIGREAGKIANTNTAYNVFVGGRAGGNDNDFGDQNVLIGYEAGYLGNQTGNTSIGHNAGRGWGTTGVTPTVGYNTSIGYQSAYNAAARTTETHNTSVGAFTARNLTAGSGNTLLGYYAGYNNLGDGNIIIGSGSVGVASMTNQLRIGNGESVTVISASLATGDIIFSSTASAAYFVGDGSQLTNLQRPISSSVSTNVTASNLNAGYYFRVGGNVNCSIQSSSFISCDVGSEFEFFQTSSAGNMLFLTGSGVTLNSKSGNITLTGQFSAATLKKVDNDEWDLIGDLS